MSAIANLWPQRLQEIARRWPRFAWDYRGLSRWLSFDESYWTAILAVGLLFSTAYLDIDRLLVARTPSDLRAVPIAARWLAPFRLRGLKDPRLPASLRTLLRAIALTAILPLGGLALPWWGQVRYRHGTELDRWAARLREPAA